MNTRIYPIKQLSGQLLQQTVEALVHGAVAAVATDTVYGLAANAFDEKAIARIYEIKQRPAGAALQLLVGRVEQVWQIAQRSLAVERLAQVYWPGGLTLILPPNEKGKALLRGFSGLGLRVPAHLALCNLLENLDFPLACTSANLHGQPVITQEKDLLEFAAGKVELILTDGNLSACASSVLDLTAHPRLLREGAVSRFALEKTLGQTIK